MSKKVIVGFMPEETKVAIIENGKLGELVIERSEKNNIVGNIYKGKIKNILPGMQAMFVDIGCNKNAFLYTGDVKNGTGISVGQEIIVQIIKEPMGNKGPRATTDLAIAGRYAVLMPMGDYVGISRRIECEEERKRLKELAEKIKPQHVGLILRTVAQGRNETELNRELEYLLSTWNHVAARIKIASAPTLLYRDVDLVIRIVRDFLNEDISEIIIDNQEAHNRVKELLQHSLPNMQTQVKLYSGKEDIFAFFDLTSELKKLNDRRIWLDCGGYIVIDHTEALAVIDVNTGKFSGGINLADTVFRTNYEAAAEIARQLRLRDIGGIIVIDFIDMDTEEYRKAILEILITNLKLDRTKTTVVGLTGLGLVEMTRKKVRRNLEGILYNECPHCHGKGYIQSPETVAIAIKRSLRFGKNKRALGRSLIIQAHPRVAEFLSKNEEFVVLQKEMGKLVTIEAVTDMHPEAFAIFMDKGEHA